MQKKKKKLMAVMLILGLLATDVFPAAAATKKKISTVSITIDADMMSEDEVGEDGIEVEVRSNNYSVDNYVLVDEDMEWGTNSVPELEITLTAAEGYYFALSKRSDVKLKGNSDPEYVSGKKMDSSSTLVVVAKLHCIQNGVGEVTNVTWSSDKPCVATWESSYNGNGYEVIVYRGDKKVGKMQAVSGPEKSIDLSHIMLTPGEYTFRVREKNYNSGKRGEWEDSRSTYILTEEIAQKNKELYGYQSLDGYGWQKDEKGWWYNTPGGPIKNDWLKNNDHWFFLDAEGYMVTGWKEIGGKNYYFNENGEMLVDTITPDGCFVDANGVKVQ